MLDLIIDAMWLMLPAYAANSSAVIFGGGTPIDLGRNFMDGKRVFGDGKTVRGFVGGVLFGVLVGLLQIYISHYIQFFYHSLPLIPVLAVFCLSAGALFGDMVASFIKRRISLKPGSPFPIVDQLDFVAGAWLMLIIVMPVWFYQTFTLEIILAVLIITPVLHFLTNILGYLMGKKKVPW
ncbi:CDP-2,3-bis-(O-geranylgeranyl)-sn-glycerol synthase [Methanosarcinales archaeon]|nr:MAG: CDP-2,3-bis-(O-geranylgeranyl)-sn-glycerol synthase [Methanosarcinales archaeon]